MPVDQGLPIGKMIYAKKRNPQNTEPIRANIVADSLLDLIFATFLSRFILHSKVLIYKLGNIQALDRQGVNDGVATVLAHGRDLECALGET